MFYKNFRINIVVRIIAILLLGYTAIYVWTQTYFWTVSLWAMLFAIILTFDLIRYVEKSKRELGNFLLSIKQGDFSSAHYNIKKIKSKEDLRFAYHEITKVFQKLRSEKESDHQYLQTVVEHVKVALLCFDENGDIQLINEAAKKLFNTPYLRNIKALQKVDNKLVNALTSLKSNRRKLLKLDLKGSLFHLSMQATKIRLQGADYKLVSVQDIKNELDEQELESWQKLIRVMTHEIMNSAIPISTLTEVTNQMLDEKVNDNLNELDSEDLSDLKGSLKTIESRSKGLVKFVNAYNSLTKIPQPNFQEIRMQDLFNNTASLLGPKLSEQEIDFRTYISDKNVTLVADPDLIEQILINLVINSMDAVKKSDNPFIELNAVTSEKGTKITVTDNGCGIDQETLENIFVPFYTTKKEGSGIGLSLSKQIMRLHKGAIEVKSEIDKGTVFIISF
ncbi:ATP-binding protein [Fulvivirgaceae bacterium BMA10]|uniref:histidine kinase n=1 Tax=Splendidivirga corallicola TaxID=3051826 RepID=A0ABT8KVD1_9BACT|nr:ATP-binding protein [Fulvivirgaceae bacterium BMA10]